MTKSTGAKAIKVVLYILAISAILIGAFSAFLMLGKDKTLNIELKGLDLQSVKDGRYVGRYNGYRWSNTVSVEVKNHQITDISVEKAQVFAKDETIRELINRVMSEQTTKVDAVSGATADSKALLCAIENIKSGERALSISAG